MDLKSDDLMKRKEPVMTMSEGQSSAVGAQGGPESPGAGGAAVQTRPARPKIRRLPPWKVLLHNDDVSLMEDVIAAIVELTTLRRQDAILRMLEAHTRGLTLLLTTHREHAELLQEQFTSKRLTVTIEPEG
jgi:ATP-dependent Clp protease adaptor protein ClpS